MEVSQQKAGESLWEFEADVARLVGFFNQEFGCALRALRLARPIMLEIALVIALKLVAAKEVRTVTKKRIGDKFQQHDD